MLPFVPMPLGLRDLVWYGVTLAAAFGAFKLSETIAGKSLAAPLVRAELFWLRLFALLCPLSSFSRYSRTKPMTHLFSLPYSLVFSRSAKIALLPPAPVLRSLRRSKRRH